MMVIKMDYLHLGIRMDKRNVKELSRIVNMMDYKLLGMKMDKRNKKGLKMNGLIGTKMVL